MASPTSARSVRCGGSRSGRGRRRLEARAHVGSPIACAPHRDAGGRRLLARRHDRVRAHRALVLGIVLPVEWWQPLGVVSALVSGTGIVLFLGTWAVFNTVAALGVDIAVLVAVVVGWPPESVYLMPT